MDRDDKSVPEQGYFDSRDDPSTITPDDPSIATTITTTPAPPPLVRYDNTELSRPGAVAVPGPESHRYISSNESLMDSTVASVMRERSPSYDDQLWSEVLINAVLVDEDQAAVIHSTRDLPFVEATPMATRQPWYTRWCITSSLLLALCIIVAVVVALTTEGGTLTSIRPPPATSPPATPDPTTDFPATASPSSAMVDLAVVIQLDEDPGDTGWSLICNDDDVVVEALPGTYDDENEMIVAIQPVENGADCMFTIFDLAGNGIADGLYEVYLGDDITNKANRLISGMGDFGDANQVLFRAEAPTLASPTLAPTIAPTEAPSGENTPPSNNELTTAPTTAPTTQLPTPRPSQSPSLAPTLMATITIVIRLDGMPGETSWRLKCGTRTIYNVPPRNYEGQENRLITVPAQLMVGEECEFTIFDAGNNGMDGGYFEVYSGEDISVDAARIVVGTGDFESEQIVPFEVVSPPTFAPTLSPAPTMLQSPEHELVPITLALQLDKFPSEIGWLFQCGDTVHGYVPPTTFVEQYQLYTKTFYVQEGAQCKFRITDSYGDGLCCQFGNGSFKLFLGEDITNESNLLAEGSVFLFVKEATFTAEKLGPTASPSPTILLPEPTTPPPTVLPTVQGTLSSPSPVLLPSVVPITIAIKLDDHPGDIGWSLQCSDSMLIDMQAGTYSEPSELVMETVQVQDGAECEFVITDAFGEGLDGEGFFRFYLADMTSLDESNLLHSGSGFGFREQFQFLARAAP